MDTVFYNGVIHTMAGRTVSALAVQNGRIALVGTDEAALALADAHTKKIDLGGRCVLPGFTDSHIHILQAGMVCHRLDLRGVTSLQEIIDRGQEYVKQADLAPGEWIIGYGFDHNSFDPPTLPDGATAEAISSDLPVILDRVCGHIGAANRKAFELAGYDEDTVIPGGELDKDEHGHLNGIIREAALDQIKRSSPRQTKEQVIARIQEIAGAVAQVDVLVSFATVAAENNYCMPTVDNSDRLEITEGRHPVVEKMRRDVLFVPNDTYMDNKEHLAAILTGPNMAGKSTYMRQVALMVLMAQMGSFVPARSARIGVVDRIFTRIGASDDLAGGQSTFMVEMTEVAELLKHATSRSLLILDEIGRGTSTYDGMSIARAVLEWCADPKRLGAKTLFATHYHELTVLEGELPGVKNFNIAARKKKDEILFLRKIVPGGADQSYGIEVANLAGLPPKVIRRAREILAELESQDKAPKQTSAREEPQVSLTALGEEEVLATLRNTQLESLTPLQAMNLLYELKAKL